MPLADHTRLRRLAFAAVSALGLAGCEQTLERKEFLSAHTGDSLAANRAIHVIDPWRKASFDTRIRADGARAGAAIVKYRSGEPINSAPAGARTAAPAGGTTQ